MKTSSNRLGNTDLHQNKQIVVGTNKQTNKRHDTRKHSINSKLIFNYTTKWLDRFKHGQLQSVAKQ